MNDLNLQKWNTDQFFRFPFFVLQYFLNGYFTSEEDAKQFAEYPNIPCSAKSKSWYSKHSMEYASKMARPRMIKSHLPLSLLPDNFLETFEVIYVTRNIKDAAVSFY